MSVRPALPPAVAAALVLVVAGCGGGEDGAELPLGKEVSVAATFEPTVHLFAEPVVARVEVVVDREHLDPGLIRLQTRFQPYDVKGFALRSEERGRLTVLRYEWTLRCLRLDCIPEILPSAAGEQETGRGERRSFVLPPARVLYEEGRDERALTRATWPELVSVSRIKQSDVPQYGFVFQHSVTPLPEADYRASPTLLGAGLLAGSLALLAFPAGLGLAWWRRRRPPPVVEEEPELTPLEHALRLVEWAKLRDDGAERRGALEVLAVELEALASGKLANEARALAWSPASPTPEQADALVDVVRKSDAHA